MDVVLPLLTLVIGVLAGVAGVLLWSRRSGDPGVLQALTARGEDQAVIRDGLDRLHERMRDLEHQKVAWQSQLHQQVEEMRHSTESLRRETGALTTALRRPHVRGQWGELQLKRTVELAGMVEHCDFVQQVTHDTDEGRLRPDLVVQLTGGKCIVVDAKVPLAAHLDALATDDPEEQRAHLVRHAAQVRAHVDQLATKAYWRAQSQSPEFVVMFVPLESSLPAALDADPGLLEHAARQRVFLATPTTLMALLRTVAHGWTSEQLAERTREVHELGRELYRRLGTLAGHVDKLGRSLRTSVDAYNRAVGSLESRVLVTARHFADLDDSAEPLSGPGVVEEAPRPLTAAELLEELTPGRPELDVVDGVARPPRRLRDLP
ncbi:MAG TPA: DNA recombination protein RmuC [Marmoricola sp.]|jgi:DNA recombination protein RmuC|nr:DNA recombination protein RmuC [Marmoricola sp.]